MTQGKESADRYSMRGRVYHQIREDILSGKYVSKEELRETAIGEDLGVSRTPVREALRQLELEGLVSIVPNKGAYVTGITPKDIEDIYVMRSYLEGLCAKWACPNLTEEELQKMEEILYLAKYQAEKGHREHLVELDDQFHGIIYEASGSKMLHHVLTDFHTYVHQVRKGTLSSVDRAKNCQKEHEAILKAFRKKDPEAAEQYAKAHIEKSLQNIQKKGLENLLREHMK